MVKEQDGRGTNPTLQRRGVDAVEVAGRLLQALAGLGGKARLKALSDATEILPAKVHRYLVSLQEVGLVSRGADTQEYCLGPLCPRLGELAAHAPDLVGQLSPIVAEFSREIGEACGIAVWAEKGVTILRWFGVLHEVSISLRPGTVVDLITSCTGCVVAAHLSTVLTEPYIRADLKRTKSDTRAALQKVYRYYAEVRRAGIAQSRGTRITGINALSVPVFGHHGNIELAVSILGHESRFSADLDSDEAHALRTLGERLTAMIGGRKPSDGQNEPLGLGSLSSAIQEGKSASHRVKNI